MIHKFERLISIGKFRNYNAAGQVNFHKLTLIYGDNGSGKTTLTSVLRSLTTNNPDIIRSRISTNHTAPQAAQVIEIATPNIHHTFGANGWAHPLTDIEIFDIYFVNENVYSGFEFNDEHKKQLHQFVIGAQGIAIQNQIEQNKSAKTISRQNQTSFEQQIIQQVGNSLTTDLITSFLAISATEANGIAQRIVTAETALASANANSVIQTLQRLSLISPITSEINFANLIADLQTTSQTIQDATLQTLFSSHCQELSENSIEGAENWLRQGFAYIESKRTAEATEVLCPFCKREINDTLDIINAYTSQFNEAFNSLIQRIETHLTSLQNFNLESAIQAINNINQINSGRIISWTTYLPANVQAPVFNIIADEARLRTEYQNIIMTVQRKLQNPSILIATDTITEFHSLLQEIDSIITNYNQSVNIYNSAITTFRNSIQTVENTQLEVNKLKRINKRFEASIETLCNQLLAEKQNLKTLETAYTVLVQQQQTAATTFFNNYQARINHYLENVFKTPFRINNVVHIPPQGRATQSKIGYKLTIDGRDISFTPNQPFNAKDCLSEGDKSTIALAFFLSKLDIDPNRQNKILVFDDPLSSLDTNRRTYTIGIIKALFRQMQQVIVLSHNEFFLNEIGKDIGVADKKTLRITENFVAKASIIEVCDLEELVKNDYFKHIEALEDFRVNPNHADKDTVLGWLRNVLESHLRFKFYREIRSMTGQKTFGRLIDFLNTSGVVFKNDRNRAAIITNLHLINSVSWKPHHGTAMPDYATLEINPNTITAPELDNLIQDTLDLINNQL
jgi:wobble nucleotide-excising tRNase